MEEKQFENKLIEVCDKCLMASCWHGKFMCWGSKNAGTVLKTVSELRKLGLEHEDNWSDKTLDVIYGEAAPHGYREKVVIKCKQCGSDFLITHVLYEFGRDIVLGKECDKCGNKWIVVEDAISFEIKQNSGS